MMESAGYELIKKEGYDEGLRHGLRQGMLADAREMVLEALAERFTVVPGELEERIMDIDSRSRLKELLRYALRVRSLEEFRDLLG